MNYRCLKLSNLVLLDTTNVLYQGSNWCQLAIWAMNLPAFSFKSVNGTTLLDCLAEIWLQIFQKKNIHKCYIPVKNNGPVTVQIYLPPTWWNYWSCSMQTHKLLHIPKTRIILFFVSLNSKIHLVYLSMYLHVEWETATESSTGFIYSFMNWFLLMNT